jgi:hypothetical protein
MPAVPSSLLGALFTDGPAADRRDAMQLYAFLIGRWEADMVVHPDAGAPVRATGEIHASWALAGRAIQDVWIMPGVFYGTTLRIYDPKIDAWHIHWLDPLTQFYPRMTGRAQGRDIVQVGTQEDGRAIRWSFTERSDDAFRWLGEISDDGGATWRLQADFHARRVPASG